MKKTLIILSVLALIVNSCGQTTKRQDKINNKVDESWFGRYSYETHPYTDGLMTISQLYILEIIPDSCVFSGIGFQLYFVEQCTVEETAPDMLTVRFYSLIEGDSSHNVEPYVVKLFRREDKYYFNSPVIFSDTENKFNCDLEVIRTRLNQ
jgi:hypothetical protein